MAIVFDSVSDTISDLTNNNTNNDKSRINCVSYYHFELDFFTIILYQDKILKQIFLRGNCKNGIEIIQYYPPTHSIRPTSFNVNQ